MKTDDDETDLLANLPVVDFREFLEKWPPGSRAFIENALGKSPQRTNVPVRLVCIELECSNKRCGGPRLFDCDVEKISLNDIQLSNSYLPYTCRHCRKSNKLFAVRWMVNPKNVNLAIAKKVGEDPEFGFDTPARVTSIIGPDRDMFLKGRLAESRNLGIGAFVYYRRVVENQKDRLFGELIRFVQATSDDDELIAQLRDAMRETQFTKSFGKIKRSLPESLKIGGRDPLQLLHSALSEGVHGLNDEECLQIATDVRRVLFSMLERIAELLKDERELVSAANRLAHLKKP